MYMFNIHVYVIVFIIYSGHETSELPAQRELFNTLFGVQVYFAFTLNAIWHPCTHWLGIRSRYGSGSRGYLNL